MIKGMQDTTLGRLDDLDFQMKMIILLRVDPINRRQTLKQKCHLSYPWIRVLVIGWGFQVNNIKFRSRLRIMRGAKVKKGNLQLATLNSPEMIWLFLKMKKTP